MKIAIIGAGFTGLTAGYDLSLAGKKVDIFETYDKVGGLASCADINGYPLERAYHHLFQTDTAIINLVTNLGLLGKLKFRKSKDAFYFNGQIYSISPLDILNFKPLSISSRLRLGLTIAFLKAYPNWKSLENKTAKEWLIKWSGKKVYETLWQPLLIGKFGKDKADQITASWFWARIKARTLRLGYFDGGFEIVCKKMASEIEKRGGQINLKEPVVAIEKVNTGLHIRSTKKEKDYEKVIFTAPISHFPLIVKNLPEKFANSIKKIEFLHAQCLVLVVKKSLTPYYWLNIADNKFPFLLTVEHTNFIPASLYGGQKILYIGNYLKSDDPRWRMGKDDLIKMFLPYLKKINSQFQKKDISDSFLFRGAHAQPVVDINYHKSIPAMTTPIKNLFLASMAQVYPYDRGTNYAVSLGHQVADLVLAKRKEIVASF